jgi:hypothetical protein
MKLTEAEARELSLILNQCQNHLEMWEDMVCKANAGRKDPGLAELIEQVKAYRKVRGWGPFPHAGDEGSYES